MLEIKISPQTFNSSSSNNNISKLNTKASSTVSSTVRAHRTHSERFHRYWTVICFTPVNSDTTRVATTTTVASRMATACLEMA
jgi:hypothetical protein